jgi:hypothetical protein
MFPPSFFYPSRPPQTVIMGLEPAHVLIAANPKSGATSGRARVEQLQQQLTQRGLHSAICYSLPELQ